MALHNLRLFSESNSYRGEKILSRTHLKPVLEDWLKVPKKSKSTIITAATSTEIIKTNPYFLFMDKTRL